MSLPAGAPSPSLTVVHAPPLRPLRLRPAPATEPHAVVRRLHVVPTQTWEQTALPLQLPVTTPADEEALFARQPTGSADLPDPAPLVAALVRAAMEVLGGSRPVSQLLRWLSADVYAALQRRASLAARVRSGDRGSRVRISARGVRVRRVVVTTPRDGVVEAAVCLADGERVRAAALRLEGLDGRWRVTALEIG